MGWVSDVLTMMIIALIGVWIEEIGRFSDVSLETGLNFGMQYLREIQRFGLSERVDCPMREVVIQKRFGDMRLRG